MIKHIEQQKVCLRKMCIGSDELYLRLPTDGRYKLMVGVDDYLNLKYPLNMEG